MRRLSFIRQDNQEEDLSVDLTPMLDVTFILLIFFIVTASFTRESGIDINRPKAVSSEAQEDSSLIIAISQKNEIWIGDQRIDISLLHSAIEKKVTQAASSNQAQVVMIQSDGLANVDTLTAVVDAARQIVGDENVSVAAQGQ